MPAPPLILPPRPSALAPRRLSLSAVLAPVLMAGAMWAMTRSPYALAFAGVGPLVALFGVVEGRRVARRDRMAATAERTAALSGLALQLEELHAAERAAAATRAPGAAWALRAPERAALWQEGGGLAVRLGLGTVSSAAVVSGQPADEGERALQREAGRLRGAAIVADAGPGIAVCGERMLATAFARSLVVQLVARLPPTEITVAAAGPEWDWCALLPHAAGAGAPSRTLHVVDGVARPRTAPTVAVFTDPGDVPPGFATVVQVDGLDRAAVLTTSDAAPLDPVIAPELVSRRDAIRFARALGSRAARLGPLAGSALPGQVRLGELPTSRGPGLSAALGRCAAGVFSLDLVAQGPHAIVAGMTGSGKSELLVSWVAAMTAAHRPAELTVLLVDFKGGMAFAPLAALPHTVGVITDLSGAEADRALRSLAAELRRREAVLGRLGCRDVAEAGGALPRLVVIVDEFAALLDAFDGFGALFTDIAARGRALGVHLILCTQRPAGVMRESLVANCPLRLSLRVQSAADSHWVVGTGEAAALRASEPGRCIVAVDGETTTVQIATTAPSDIAAIAAAAPRSAVFRPWLDPLPERLGEAELAAADAPAEDGAAIGVVDLPEEQRRERLTVSSRRLPLFVLGAPGSGKSSLLRLLAQRLPGETRLVGADQEAAWDVVSEAVDRCDTDGGAPLTLLLDDVDAVLSRLGDEHAQAWCDGLARLLRDGARAGVFVVVAAQRVTAPLRAPLALARETVLLRQPSRQDHLLAGGPATLYDERLPPGGGVWQGRRVQFLAPSDEAVPMAAAKLVDVPLRPRPGTATVVVCRAPERLLRQARDAGVPAGSVLDLGASPVTGQGFAPEEGTVLAGDPDAWIARWPVFAAARARHPIVFQGCGLVELRAVTRARGPLPPPLAPGGARCWILDPDGVLRRGRLLRS